MRTLEDRDTCGRCRSGNDVQWTCLECDIYLCKSCKPAHLKQEVEFGHDIVDISGKLGVREKIPLLCNDHAKEKLVLRCMTCKESACLQCLEEKHNGHKMVSSNAETRDKLQNCLHLMEDIWLQHLKTELKAANENALSSNLNSECLKQKIIRRGETIKVLIDGIVAGVVKSIDDTKSQNQRFFKDLTDEISEEIQTIKRDIKKIKKDIISESRELDNCSDRVKDKHNRFMDELKQTSRNWARWKLSFEGQVDRTYFENLLGIVTVTDEDVNIFSDCIGEPKRENVDLKHAVFKQRNVQNTARRRESFRRREQNARENTNGCRQQ